MMGICARKTAQSGLRSKEGRPCCGTLGMSQGDWWRPTLTASIVAHRLSFKFSILAWQLKEAPDDRCNVGRPAAIIIILLLVDGTS
jgi:hypothetical protein